MSVYYPRCHAVLSVLFDGLGDRDTPRVFNVLPRNATVRTNGYKEADTWELEFDARALPVSPEQIRAMEARIYMYAAESLNDPFERYFSVDNEAVIGLADMATARWGSDGRSLHVEGRDYTALLIDRTWNPTKRVPVGKPIDKLVQDLVNEALNYSPSQNQTGRRTLEVVYKAPDAVPVVDDTSMYKTKSKGQYVKAGTNFWDVIYGICLSHGFVCYVEGQKLIIHTPQALFQDAISTAHRVAYGRDLAWLEIERKMGKEVTPQVVASAYDPTTKRIVQATYPDHVPSPAELGKVVAGIGVKRNERVFVTAPYGVRTQPEVLRYATTYYNTIARGEAVWRFATKDLKDLNGRDLIKLKAASPVKIDWDPFNREDMHSLDEGKRAQLLVSLGYSRDVASVIATNWDLVRRNDHPFYCREVTRNWTDNDGLEVQVEAMNFISVGRGEGRG